MTIHRVHKPPFLNRLIAEQAIKESTKTALDLRPMMHVVVLAPQINLDRPFPDNPLEPFVLAEMSFGDKALWEHKLDEIARSRALQCWHGRSDERTTPPHLMFPTETLRGCGVRADGLVVAIAGSDPYSDKFIARRIIDLCVARAQQTFTAWERQYRNADFLPPPF